MTVKFILCEIDNVKTAMFYRYKPEQPTDQPEDRFTEIKCYRSSKRPVCYIKCTCFVSDISSIHRNVDVWLRERITGTCKTLLELTITHDDVIKRKYFPRYWPFVWGIHRSPVNSLHKGQWRRALMFTFINAWINGWVSNGEAVDLRRHRAHYDVIVII